MKSVYILYTALVISLLIMILICAPHSCEWGNNLYFFFGFGVWLFLLIRPFFLKNLTAGKMIITALGISLLWVILWVLGFLFGGFSLLCRLF